jgi:DNA repair protein RadC
LERRATDPGDLLSDPATCGKFFRLRLAEEPREHFEVAFLDTQNRLLAVERLFSGSISESIVHPRIVVQRALAHNAAAVLLAHNHPSGHVDPSRMDVVITKELKKALALVDVQVLDHLVVTNREWVSLVSRGLI